MNAGADGLAHLPIVKLAEPQWVDGLKAHHMSVITTIGFTDFYLTPGRLAAKLPDDPLMKALPGTDFLASPFAADHSRRQDSSSDNRNWRAPRGNGQMTSSMIRRKLSAQGVPVRVEQSAE